MFVLVAQKKKMMRFSCIVNEFEISSVIIIIIYCFKYMTLMQTNKYALPSAGGKPVLQRVDSSWMLI